MLYKMLPGSVVVLRMSLCCVVAAIRDDMYVCDLYIFDTCTHMCVCLVPSLTATEHDWGPQTHHQTLCVRSGSDNSNKPRLFLS